MRLRRGRHNKGSHVWARRHAALAIVVAVGPLSGCAVHWYDEATQTEHLLGFGHMKMKIAEPNEGVRAVVTGTETLGLALRADRREGYFLIGWQELSQLRAIDENTQIRFEWPSADFFSVRLGSEFPFGPDEAPVPGESPPKEVLP